MMRALVIAVPAVLALSACADFAGRITDFTGLSQEQLMCIGAQVAAMSSDTPKREAAGQIATACGIDVETVVFGKPGESTTVLAEGQQVVVAE